jgi:chaperonin cofactor prefoldin
MALCNYILYIYIVIIYCRVGTTLRATRDSEFKKSLGERIKSLGERIKSLGENLKTLRFFY